MDLNLKSYKKTIHKEELFASFLVNMETSLEVIKEEIILKLLIEKHLFSHWLTRLNTYYIWVNYVVNFSIEMESQSGVNAMK